jgi:energy-coupling factor transport system ATP-binding protein
MNVLEIKNLTLSYEEKTLFSDLSFCVNEGEIVGVRGLNGAGKTTLCKRIAGLKPQGLLSEGSVLLYGTEVDKLSVADRCGNLSIVFQEPEAQLFSPYVEDELAFAQENLCIERAEIKKRISAIARLVGIEHLIKQKTNNLSGGEKQLVAIAGALVMYPRVLIADEITARLYKDAKENIRCLIKDFAKNGGAVVFVHHTNDDAAICTRFIDL